MRRLTIKNGWSTPRLHYSGTWQQNPWLSATNMKARSRNAISNAEVQKRQQQAAIRIWESEGGRIDADDSVR
jgi:hypothetical protein